MKLKDFKQVCAIDTDYQETGKTYPEIDLFVDGAHVTMSRQFESQDSFKSWFSLTYDVAPERIATGLTLD